MMKDPTSPVVTALVVLVATVKVKAFSLPQHLVHMTKSAALLQQRQIASNSFFPRSLWVSTDSVSVLSADGAKVPFTFLADGQAAMETAATVDVMGLVQNVALGVTAVLFLLAGLTYLTASVLIPAGAQQLEVECQAIIPRTWQDYLDKLEDGQTMKDRPDLMFELGLLLNKAKADQLERMCRQTDNMDLWSRYQQQLQDGQALQDRADLIQRLSMELGERAVEKIKANSPPELWQRYESKLVPGESMAMRQDLLMALTQEPEYVQMFDATETMKKAGTGENTVIDVTPSKSQWDE
jgi:cell fate (sporulation/competence/biofilm development) regulator YmcA (YheA/YmcA/DUF963 family)